ncbi:hypothetical protein CP532_4833, partial [Ophiocordyceps camponoti-leonardi (nom. inval.)]
SSCRITTIDSFEFPVLLRRFSIPHRVYIARRRRKKNFSSSRLPVRLPSPSVMAPNNGKNDIARLLYAMIRQMGVKTIDWDQVACDPVLLQPICSGHAARMRYFRFEKTVQRQDGRRISKSNGRSPTIGSEKGLERETSPVVKTEPAEEQQAFEQCPPTPAVSTASPNLDNVANTIMQPRTEISQADAPFYTYDSLERISSFPQAPHDDGISQTAATGAVSLPALKIEDGNTPTGYGPRPSFVQGAASADVFLSPCWSTVDMLEPAVTTGGCKVESPTIPSGSGIDHSISGWNQQDWQQDSWGFFPTDGT